MPCIQRLPEDLANQIAAGEVVERPASVIKELIENSIDAASTRVQIDVEGGGTTLLRVSDDGVGMDEADACLAVERHATSKIRRIEDLLELVSFGFRGEALPSIASVSKFSLRTRRREDNAGVDVRVEAGGPPDMRPCGMAPGTIVEVRNLFFNVPARRKFLKATATESGHITDVVEAMALASPSLTVTLSRDGRQVREWLRTEGRSARARDAFANEELAELRGRKGSIEVLALLGRPERARASSASLKLFVNGRLVRDRTLQRTVLQAYGGVLPVGRFPVGVVFAEVPPDRVDVNVHPQKAEVRFADTRSVTDALFSIVSLELGRAFGLPAATRSFARPSAYSATNRDLPPSPNAWQWNTEISPPSSDSTLPSPSLPLTERSHSGASDPFAPTQARPALIRFAPEQTQSEAPSPMGSSPTGAFCVSTHAPSPSGDEALSLSTPTESAPPLAAPSIEQDPWELNAGSTPVSGMTSIPPTRAAVDRTPRLFSSLRFLAQAKNTFLLCEGTDGLTIIDQHAAAERVTFHRLRSAFRTRTVALQPLLFPMVIEVSAAEAALIEEQHETLLAAGLDARIVGPRRVAIHGVPKILQKADPEGLLRDLLAETSRSSHSAFTDAIDLALATMACHGSVRAGDHLAPEEVTALLASLDEVDFAGHCPHGRPIVTILRWDELERKVGRR